MNQNQVFLLHFINDLQKKQRKALKYVLKHPSPYALGWK